MGCCCCGGSSLSRTPDPITGLSERDRALIRKSWFLVSERKKVTDNGVEFFVQLFRKYPHMKRYFRAFQFMDEEELRKSPEMRAYASRVMSMLSLYISSLDNAETLIILMHKVCDAHMKRNVSAKDFEYMTSMFVPYLKSLLGTKVTPEITEAWSKLLETHNTTMRATITASRNNS